MPIIKLSTEIKAPQSLCFDLSRSVELHLQSTQETQERVVAGRTTGFFEEGDVVTWEAIHFGIRQQLTVKITKVQHPDFFEDVMLKGAFANMEHQHYFEEYGEFTIMRDVFTYRSPLGLLGILADKLFLENYMRKFLVKRNDCIKKLAEEQFVATL